jgi:phosphoenolpyruvate synthase/pyruvate phosphate dikinase
VPVYSPNVLSRQEVLNAALSLVGAKAATLARMARQAVPVPDFFVITSDAFARHLATNRIAWPQSGSVSADVERLRGLADEIRGAPVPEIVSGPVLAAYKGLRSRSGHGRVAVRSSGAEEDSASDSFAGQFASILGVGGAAELLDAVKECWASYLSAASLGYRSSRGAQLGRAPGMGVIVQVQVFSQKAGVLFTVHPLEPDRDIAYIEANYGTGESVVGGLATPDAITVSRSSAEVLETTIATKRRMTSVSPDWKGSRVVDVEDSRRSSAVLTESEAQQIVQVGLDLESLLGGPQDIEWAFDAHGIWILQSRPVTTLGMPERT